jgi:hypothetical protein
VKPYVGVVLIVFGYVYPFTQDPQESRVFECLPHIGSGMGVLLAVEIILPEEWQARSQSPI